MIDTLRLTAEAAKRLLDAREISGAELFAAYRAAIDREEAAARDLQRLCVLTQPCQEQLAQP